MHLPGPLRAAVGLIATAAAEVRQLPDRAIELPMLAVSSALQASLRTQQRYARLAARGDDVLNRRRPTSEPPPWATFDEPVPVEDLRRAALAELNRFGAGDDPLASAEPEEAPAEEAPAEKADATKAPARTAASKRASAKHPPAKKAPAKKSTAAKSTAEEKSTAEKSTAENGTAPVTETVADAGEGKSVSKPRHTAPSRFDDAGD